MTDEPNGLDPAVAAQQAEIARIDQMADVMKQRGHNERFRCALLYGEVRGLQRMLFLRHVLAEIRRFAVSFKQSEDLIYARHRFPRS